jgi:hypothetical protein
MATSANWNVAWRASVSSTRPFSRTRHQTTEFRHAAFAGATRYAAHPAPITTPSKSGCRQNAAMKASVADAAGMRRQAGRPATLMRPSIFVRSLEATVVASAPSSAADSPRSRCPTAESRFATVCYGLRIGCRRNRTVTRAQAPPAYDHGRQISWLPAGREIGSRTVEERPDSSPFECCAQNADRAGRRSE